MSRDRGPATAGDGAPPGLRGGAERRGPGPKLALLAALCLPPAAAGQTPEQPLFEWDTPAFPGSEYEDRRATLLAHVEESNAVFLAFSGQGLSHGETFRQLDDFSYLVGLELPESILAVDGPRSSATLFVPARDHRFASASRPNDFPGRRLTSDPEIRAWASDVDIRDASELGDFMESLAERGVTVLVNPGSAAGFVETERSLFAHEEEVVGTIRAAMRAWPDVRFDTGYPTMAALRSVKSEREIHTMERVARMTARSIVRAARSVGSGVRERALEGAFLDACKSDGSQRAAYAPIIKSGPNSLWPWRVLASHYDRRDRQMENGDLVIFDVGCELDGYVSDVGRTFPVSGLFTERQRAVLDMEVDVADAIIAAVRPGVTLAELQSVADAAIPAEAKPFMQVGLFFGHHLGLSTGDPVMTDEPLRPGMVFTVEPWYYNHGGQLSVFTEDQILVTEDGARNLTADLPRRPDELERLMRTGVVHGLSVDPDLPRPPASLTDLVDEYASAWNETNAERRALTLARVWAPAGRYRDPTGRVHGPESLSDHIQRFQEQQTGVTVVRSSPVSLTGSLFRFAWEILDRSGMPIASGWDTGELDVDGRILDIRGFFDG